MGAEGWALGLERQRACAMKNLLWLAPDLPKNSALVAMLTIRDAIRKLMRLEIDVEGQPNHIAVAFGHGVEEGTAPHDVAQYCLYSTQVQRNI